jgi:thiol-disulfide isomerase/thioredoxin
MKRIIIAALAAAAALTLTPATPHALAAATQKAGEKSAKPLHVSKGAPVKLTDYLVPGKTVVFDFYSDFCPPCVRVAPALEKLHASRSDVVVVKVDINRPETKGRIDWQSPVAKQFRLNSIPHFKVYGPDGKLQAEDGPTSDRARKIVMAMIEKSP